ncbi:MAG TPA: glycosyltransferase family 92 protein [Methylocystis sp.]|nr:glycosyltransferase family 92 protein [Methylocystis sp.]
MRPIFRLVGVAIVKNEASYIEEWVCHHLNLGFDHFYIFNNNSEDNLNEVLAPYINYGVVTLIHWPLKHGQLDAYRTALRLFGHTTEWMSFFDLDEFYMLRQYETIPELLATIDADQVLVCWKLFGHSEHLARPDGLVMENYTHCEGALNSHNKCIVRPESVKIVDIHHCATYSGLTVNSLGELVMEMHEQTEGLRSDRFIWINHYCTKSYEEYVAKVERGKADRPEKNEVEPFTTFSNAYRDDYALKYVGVAKKLMHMFSVLPNDPSGYGAFSSIGGPTDPCSNRFIADLAMDAMGLDEGGARLAATKSGAAVSFLNESLGDKISQWILEKLPQLEMHTRSKIVASSHKDGFQRFEFHNITNMVTRGSHVEFHAVSDDPKIISNIDPSEGFRRYWVCCALLAPADTRLDIFLSGQGAREDCTFETRSIDIKRGINLVLLSINIDPFRADYIRLDPGSLAGDYRLYSLTILSSRWLARQPGGVDDGRPASEISREDQRPDPDDS